MGVEIAEQFVHLDPPQQFEQVFLALDAALQQHHAERGAGDLGEVFHVQASGRGAGVAVEAMDQQEILGVAAQPERQAIRNRRQRHQFVLAHLHTGGARQCQRGEFHFRHLRIIRGRQLPMKCAPRESLERIT